MGICEEQFLYKKWLPALTCAASYVDKKDTPFLIFHGDRDQTIPVTLLKLFDDYLKLANAQKSICNCTWCTVENPSALTPIRHIDLALKGAGMRGQSLWVFKCKTKPSICWVQFFFGPRQEQLFQHLQLNYLKLYLALLKVFG